MVDTVTTASPDTSNDEVRIDSLISQMNQTPKMRLTPEEALKAAAANAENKAKLDAELEKIKSRRIASVDEPYKQKIQETGRQQEQIANQMKETYHVPQETVSDYAQLAGIVGVLGVMLGKSGKQSATNVLSAIDGTLKGYQQGRKDMIVNGQKEFEINMKRLQAEAAAVAATLESATKLRAVDLEQANQKFAELKARAYQGIAASDYVANNSMKTIEVKAQLDNLALRSLEYENKIKQQNLANQETWIDSKTNQAFIYNTATHKTTDLQGNPIDPSVMGTARKMGAAQSKAGGLGEGMPKTAQEISQTVNRYQTIKNLEDLDTLLNDPKYSKYITPATKLEPAVLQRLAKDFPELESKLARMQAGEFLIGGKALTGPEQAILEPIYGWKGITADALKTRVRVAKQDMQNQQAIYENLYPGLTAKRQVWDQVYENSRKPTIPVNSVLDSGSSGSTQASSQEREAALAWIAANPNDPRVPEIKKKLGVQ